MANKKYFVTINYDEKDRITSVWSDNWEGLPHSGHSVCSLCGRDMPRVWDTVCSNCGRTSCYNHSVDYNGYWYCLFCISDVVAKGKRHDKSSMP